ncbi:membrane protein [Nocardiopsis kunsanensis]|uniref:Membrane protein n=1 Tax=Nocardiopsis kunsanensis TaxID=141693 RepID=A0A918XGZ5_9ACTN|nr:MHYT domain-containing protein [Nocardiopsis kunsanensis]GHD30899.1 membrane protein [Nocardiopsis kunsanensis]
MLDLLVQDWPAPALAYLVSVIGSYLGLSFAARARRSTGFSRWQWLGLAALTLGGVAVWSMHFIAMMGFSAPGTAIRYDMFLTVASGITAIVVMGTALYLTLFDQSLTRLLLSGPIAGLGVVSMHYMGMASMNIHGEMHHDLFWIIIAVVVAIVAATTALWFASRIRGQLAIVSASLVMAVAVSLMHYSGMAGMQVEPAEGEFQGAPEGATAFDLMLPLVVGLFVFVLICSLFLLLGADDDRPPRTTKQPVRPSTPTHPLPNSGRERQAPRNDWTDASPDGFGGPHR